MINYKPLLKQLIDREMTRTDLQKYASLSPVTLAKIGRNEYVSLRVLERICEVLECDIEDVIEVKKEISVTSTSTATTPSPES